MKRFIQIIEDEERFELRPDNTETTFYYRRMPSNLRIAMEKKLQKIASANPEAMAQARVNEVMRHCVTGWAGVVDRDGKDVSFDPDLLPRLPDNVRLALLTAINATTAKEVEDEDLGNSDATPPTE